MQLRSSHTSDHSSVHNALLFQGFWFVRDLFRFVFRLTTIYNPAANCAKKSSHHAFIFSRNSELRGQSLWTAQLCRHRPISVFLLLRKPRLCFCFRLLCRLCICHLFSVRHLHIVIRPSRQLNQLPQCIQVPRPLRQVPRLLLHRTQQFICSPGLLSRHNPHRKDLFLEFL